MKTYQRKPMPCRPGGKPPALSVRTRLVRLLLCVLLSSSLSFFPAAIVQAQAWPETGLYRIVTGESLLRIRVGRAGLLGRLGHNHAIINRAIHGSILIDPDPSKSVAELGIPVEAMQVDVPAERTLAGPGFESVPDQSAREGTRSNMLGPHVLDAGRWPLIYITTRPSGVATAAGMFEVELQLRGKSIRLQLPATLASTRDGLQVESAFSLDHDQIGLKPFSALGGTLQVADALLFELTIIARRESP